MAITELLKRNFDLGKGNGAMSPLFIGKNHEHGLGLGWGLIKGHRMAIHSYQMEI